VKFRTLVEQTNDWVWEIDLEGRFRYSNPKVFDILGYEPEEVLGKTTFDFMPAAEVQRLYALLNRFMTQQAPFTGVEKVLIHKSGQVVDLETSGAPIVDRVGKLQGYCGMARNITERKQTERKIQQALAREQELRALKSQFISMASHEFGAPLSTITLAAELLEHYGHHWSEAERLERLKCIQTAAAQMRELLADILVIGQAEAGKVECQLVAVNLPEFCRGLVAQLQFQAGSQQTLALSCNCTDSSVYLDEKRLRQVLVNLLSNAMKYSPDGGVIQMQVSCDQSYVRFEIQDSGIGIPPEDQRHLFDSFYRAKNVGGIAGTGLGLAIVKQCVEAMGGDITVESRVGIGTTFRLTLPLEGVVA
jgi:PAS domain S-box-containing protein